MSLSSDITKAVIIFPHQLFKIHPAVQKDRVVFLVEEELYFNQYNFHKKKLILHRASMKFYENFLQKQGITVDYIEASEKMSDVRTLIKSGIPGSVTEIHYADVADNWLEKRIILSASKKNIRLIKYSSPAFINTMKEGNEYFDDKKRYFQTDFYIHERKKLHLLVDEKNKPLGGKWSFDEENRLKFPKGQVAPAFHLLINKKYIPDAIEYINKKFGSNYGDDAPPFQKSNGFYPVTHEEAEKWLDDFLNERFQLFGNYEDAMVPAEGLLYHSLLSPLLNIGLITPQLVLDKAIVATKNNNIPLNSTEGFIRQLIGWREYIRIVYEREGTLQRNKNYWKFTRKIPSSFWTGETGLDPVDIVVKKVLQNGYCHHIERLMVMGNIMLLCEFDPDEVYRWFMEMFIDAYDWVMVPNTYGMTQFADGGLMMTKPYISSSNYLMKMGNWPTGEWQTTWDALFWRFMAVHRDFFESNPRLQFLLKSWDKMAPEKKNALLNQAEFFLEGLDRS